MRVFTASLAALLVLARPLGAATIRNDPVDLAEPDYSLYHTKDGVLKAVHQIVESCSSIMSVEERYAEIGGYNTTMTIVTVEPGGLTVGGDSYSNKTRLLVNYGEHGRELISSELSLALLSTLCNTTTLSSTLSSFNFPQQPDITTALLPATVFKIIPMENLHGRELVEGGALCERKNGRGVDPNRNWEVHWGFKEADYDPKEEFPGKAPFSEPEAFILKQLAEEFKPHAWVNVHSGMEAMFMPYDHKNTIPDGDEGQATFNLLKNLNTLVCHERCAIGSGGKAVGYLAHGTATDYMYDKLHTPLSLTWEVYGDLKASYHDCFRMFNPLDAKTFDVVVKSWTGAVFGLLQGMQSHPAVVGWNSGGGRMSGAGSSSVNVSSSVVSKEQMREEIHSSTSDLKTDIEQQSTANSTGSPLSTIEETRNEVNTTILASQNEQQQQQAQQQPERNAKPEHPILDNNNNNEQQHTENEEIELVIPTKTQTASDNNTLSNQDQQQNDDEDLEGFDISKAKQHAKILGRRDIIDLPVDAGLPTSGFEGSRTQAYRRAAAELERGGGGSSIALLGMMLTVTVVVGAVYSTRRKMQQRGMQGGGGSGGYKKVRSPSPGRWRKKRPAVVNGGLSTV